MHIVEAYATNCGVKIGKPFIYPKYYPLKIDNYITLHPASKKSKSYDYWQEVVNILAPVLEKVGITIVQIGTAADPKLRGCYITSGQTNINQVAYLVQNSLLHLGVDSFPTHIASSFDKKIVSLYSNNNLNNVKPYWGNPSNQILLTPNYDGKKPSYSLEENPKTINTIYPETIAKSVCKLLDIDFDYNFSTVCVGNSYLNRIVESVPNSVVDIRQLGVQSLIMRMDFLFDENILAHQMSLCPCSVITDKPVDIELLKRFRPNLVDVYYVIDKNHNPEFVESLEKLGTHKHLLSYLPEQENEDIKIHYMEQGIIHWRTSQKPEGVKNEDIKNLKYLSNKFTLSEGKIFPSKSAWLKGKQVDSFNPQFLDVINDLEFWKESEHFYFLKNT